MGMKEKIASATNTGSLAWHDEGEERAVDRIAALGLAQVRVVGEGEAAYAVVRDNDYLASCLWRLKYGGDRSSATFQQAFRGVFARVRGRDNPHRPNWVLHAVISVAIEEWRVEVCPTCRGRQFTGGAYDVGRKATPGKTSVCLTCNGFGILERSDSQRAEAVMNLLRLGEAERIRRSRRLVRFGGFTLVVTPRPEHIPDLPRVWGHNWGAKYQEALEIIVGLDARLSGKIRRKLDDSNT